MNIKVYNRRGRRNYKEIRLVSELEKELEKRLVDEPRLALSFKPADTFEELQAMHTQYVARDAEFEEIKTPKNQENMAKRNSENIENELVEDIDLEIDDSQDDNSFIDPFNRQEPTTYDYTNDGGFAKDSTPKNTGQTDFAEPLSFDEAFEIPEDGENEDPVENQKSSKKPDQEKTQKRQAKKEDPWNPAFDEMSNGTQKKSTKKFAKYIVEAVCAVAEKGFTWWANKDINDAKLAEYELNDEMNLNILVSLENGQEVTVKRFFQTLCLSAEELSKFSDEEKKDLTEVLSAVLLEKGIAPTTSQEAMMVAGGILIKKFAMLLSLKSQSSSLLAQLRVMNTNQPQYQPEPQYQQPQPQPQNEAPINQVYSEANGVPNMSYEEAGLVSDVEMLDIERVVDTKE
jgi:hypothetical protein